MREREVRAEVRAHTALAADRAAAPLWNRGCIWAGRSPGGPHLSEVAHSAMGLWTEFTQARAVTLWAGDRRHSQTRSYTPIAIQCTTGNKGDGRKVNGRDGKKRDGDGRKEKGRKGKDFATLFNL